MKFSRARWVGVCGGSLWLWSLAGVSAGEKVASLLAVQGPVQVRRSGREAWEAARARLPLFEKDEVATGPEASAVLLFADGRRVELAAESRLIVEPAAPAEQPVTREALQAVAGELPAVEVPSRTPDGVAGVKGLREPSEGAGEGPAPAAGAAPESPEVEPFEELEQEGQGRVPAPAAESPTPPAGTAP